MTKQRFYEEVKNNWMKMFSSLKLPNGFYTCEIDKHFYVFDNKEDKEYAENILGGELSSYLTKSLVCVAGVPYNDGSRLLITLASKTIKHWQNNPTARNTALSGAFKHITKGVDVFEHFNEYIPNRYTLILDEIVS